MRRASVLLMLAVTLQLCGCGRHEPKADFVFVSGVEINTLDPQKMTWNQDIRVAGCLWETLVRFKLPDMTIEPGAAESWTLGDDGLTYRFAMRSDAKWSNGDPVTANDFIVAWRRAMLPDFAADYAQLFFGIRGAKAFFDFRQQQLKTYAAGEKTQARAQQIWREACDEQFAQMVGLHAPDERTLVVELDKPVPYFLELCAFASFMPNHAASLDAMLTLNPDTGMAELPASFWTRPGNLVTNGPYQLARYRFKRDLLMTENPHWWNRATMRNHSILQRVIENPNTAMLSYENGQAHWLPDIPTNLTLAADLVVSGRDDVHRTPWAGTYFYSFNCKTTLADGRPNPLADPRVRRALAMAIDRQTLVEQVTRMRQPAAKSFIPPHMIPGYEPPLDHGAGFDPHAARQLLIEAGYTDPGKLTGLSILFNTGGGHVPVAQAIAHQWKQHLGIDVTLEGQEVRSFRERLKTWKYTIARASWIGDYRDPTTFLDKYQTGGGNNDSAWSNARYDELLRQARNDQPPDIRMTSLRQAEAILLDEQPIAPIYHYITLDVYDPRKVEGLNLNAWNFRRLEQVRATSSGE
ncbi:MAG: peptide ABC transporter substrate-binding protein [Phycisphaeraceae bacterium]|nr:peptide ABC transporter substrate-binding protein [Phycisphaeraceae bacterium]